MDVEEPTARSKRIRESQMPDHALTLGAEASIPRRANNKRIVVVTLTTLIVVCALIVYDLSGSRERAAQRVAPQALTLTFTHIFWAAFCSAPPTLDGRAFLSDTLFRHLPMERMRLWKTKSLPTCG
ncbi:MAG: hypothetical protein WKF30_02010 [Pyrinomonadaceae bacterium]